MKKILKLSFVALACALLAVSCNKTGNDITPDNPKDENPVGKVVTISARLSEALTKVAFAPYVDGSGKAILKLTWEDTDKLIVADHANPSTAAEFDLVSGDGNAEATFSGTLPAGASSYDVSIKNSGAVSYNSISQAADNDASHLEYIAAKKGLTDLDSVEFDEVCGVLGITAKMPDDVAATVRTVTIVASESIFNSGNTLTIELGTATDEGDDDILRLYAPLPATSQGITAGTTLLIRFNGRYTRFITLGASTLTPGMLNEIKVNCSHTDQYAGGDGTSADSAYLIGDPYQLASVNDLATGGSTTHFKLIDNIDMTGVTHNHINTNSGYTQVVNFNGNNKTISNLGKDLFYVLKGSVYDFTLDNSNVTARGILAEYIQGTGNIVSNVTVSNGTVTYNGSDAGALIGYINNGTSADAVTATITDCSVSSTDVSGVGVVGGVVGYANAKVKISGCTFTGGTVKATARYCGGLIGSTGDYASEIIDCHVTDATVSSSSDRIGGCVGQIGRKGVTFKGCTVGTSGKKVAVGSTLSGANVNLGGFAGVCYGTVTKNGDVRSETHVTITSGNTDTSKYVNIAGFVGYLEEGTIEYSDADAEMPSIKGHQVGGFAGVLTNGGTCTVNNCTANATVSGNNYVAGFIGQAAAADHVITNNTSAGTVSGAATVAGFIGLASQGTLTNNSTSCTVTASGANSGNFAGQLNGNVTVSKCFCTGSVTGNGNVCGGFTGIASNGATINDCYSTCTIGGGTRKRGGIAGYVDAGTVSINRCYTTSNISNNFEMGGLVGFVSVETFTMTKCAAWNGTLVAASRLASNWSSAACVGVAFLTCTLTDNYRNPNMDSLIYWGTNSDCSLNLPNTFQHPNVSTSAPLTDPDGNAVTSSTMRPYQGKCDASKTLSQLASTTLGWSSDVWDFTGDLPTLK